MTAAASTPARRAAPPLLRDPWAWLAMLPLVGLVLHSLGAPLGEPVAEDFDFLHHAMFESTHTLLDGGGSTAFWRPVAHQIYYLALGPAMLSHPRWVAGFHVLCVALAALLIYRALRLTWSGPAAAVAASFPLIAESMRALLSWSSYFVDLGLMAFSALAIHEASRRRLWTALASLALALGCKEVAIVTALMLPWMPATGPRGWRERLRWAGATAALVAAWGFAYLAIRHRAHLELPHGLEHNAATIGTPLTLRFAWATFNSVRAALSMPSDIVTWERAAGISVLALALVTLALILARPAARTALGGRAPWIAWGFAWFGLGSATLVVVYPIWAPTRSLFGSIGLGIALAALVDLAHPWLLAALVALRVATFAMSPGPPPIVTSAAPQSGAFLDFDRLVRLQRLMDAVRTRLRHDYPTLPHGARICQQNMPRLAEYSFGGSFALQAWYRDTTLRWVRYEEFTRDTTLAPVTVVQYQPDRMPLVALVEPRAIRLMENARAELYNSEWARVLKEMNLADSLLTDRGAAYSIAIIQNRRAVALSGLGRMKETEEAGRSSLYNWPEIPYARYWIAYGLFGQNRLREAEEVLDTALVLAPDDSLSRELRQIVQRERRNGSRGAPGAVPGPAPAK